VRDDARKTQRNLAQEFIASEMSEGVVNGFKTIEIKQEKGSLIRGERGNFCEKCAAVC
jgi:hypothetical protein